MLLPSSERILRNTCATAFPNDAYSVVSTLILNEQDLRSLDSAIAALGLIDDPRAVPLIANFHSHQDRDIRFSVACSLGSFLNDPLSVTTLLRLMKDDDADVRDWAAFGVGVLGNANSPKIREAIFRALDDSDEDVREEALVGLAKRHDLRALSSLLRSLEDDNVSMRVIEAAYTLLGFENE